MISPLPLDFIGDSPKSTKSYMFLSVLFLGEVPDVNTKPDDILEPQSLKTIDSWFTKRGMMECKLQAEAFSKRKPITL